LKNNIIKRISFNTDDSLCNVLNVLINEFKHEVILLKIFIITIIFVIINTD